MALSEKHENEAWDSDVRTLIHGLDAIDPQEMSDLKQWINEMKTGHSRLSSRWKGRFELSSLLLDEAARIAVPALRERKDDIKPLVTYYIASYHGTLGTSPIKIKEEAIQLLTQYDWPGQRVGAENPAPGRSDGGEGLRDRQAAHFPASWQEGRSSVSCNEPRVSSWYAG